MGIKFEELVAITIVTIIFPRERHCVKNVSIQNCFGPYFPTFGIKTEIYRVNLRIQSGRENIQIRNLRIPAFFTQLERRVKIKAKVKVKF